jgi:hypothetical protein
MITGMLAGRRPICRNYDHDRSAGDGQHHCQVGNIGLSIRIVLDWLAGLAARDR